MNYFLFAIFALTLIDKTTSYVDGYGSIDHNDGYEFPKIVNEDAYISRKHRPYERDDRTKRKTNPNTWRSESPPRGRESHVRSITNIDTKNSNKTFGSRERLSESLMRTLGGKSEASLGRFFSIFELVNFENEVCVSTSGVRGVCVHAFECISAMGQEVDSCANGYGVCCKFEYTCGEQSKSNRTTFTNPGFPNPSDDRLACTLTVHKMHPQIVQLRFDIVQMEPPTNGTCVDDQFVITGQNTNSIIPILCGINNGQHIYAEVDESSGPFYVSILSVSEASRIFQIEIYQIEEGSSALAPSGCLQYFRDPEGVLESFNYQMQSNLVTYKAPSYFNHLNYAICIKRASSTCSITYSTFNEEEEFEFQILNYDADGIPVIPPGQAGAEIFNCPDDFIIANGIRLCGERLNDATVSEDFTMNTPVTELSGGPILFIFRTSGNVTGRGFHLFYKQNNCFASRIN